MYVLAWILMTLWIAENENYSLGGDETENCFKEIKLCNK